MRQRNGTMKSLLTLLFCGSLGISSACSAYTLSRFCEAKGYQAQGNKTLLNTHEDDSKTKTAVFVVRNISGHPLIISHHDKTSLFATSWKSDISPNAWSAIMVENADFPITCSLKSEQGAEVIPCQDNLEICKFARVRISIASLGTYWVAENKLKLGDVMKKIRKKGIRFKTIKRN
jgi:hypothetical protein